MNTDLNVTNSIQYNNSIQREEEHTYEPHSGTAYGNNDEIRIPIYHEDIYTTPHNSKIVIEGSFLKNTGEALTEGGAAILSNNGFAFLFDEIRYELFGQEIDKCKNVGITSTMKGYVSLKSHELKSYNSCGWDNQGIVSPTGQFKIAIPLNLLLGFAEDHKHAIVNAKQELIIMRARSDNNSYINAAELKVQIIKIQWRIKHIFPSDKKKLELLNIVNNKIPLCIVFRSWSLYTNPLVLNTTDHTWSIKTSTSLETPRYIILGFQTNINNKPEANCSLFHHCDIRHVMVYLNSQRFPYERQNENFTQNKYEFFYHMYCKFQELYYNNHSSPLFNWADFKTTAPLIVVDCSKQTDMLKSGSVDIKIEYEAHTNFPNNTQAFCLIIHDKAFEYTPLNGVVNPINIM